MAKIRSETEEFEALIKELSRSIQMSVLAFNPQKFGIHPDDLVQEIQIKLWKIFSSDKKIQNYSSYIKRVINSILIDQIRISRRQDRIIDLEKQRTLQDEEISQVPVWVKKNVHTALNSLIESRRLVIKWFSFGLDTEEIAMLLKMDETKAKNLLYRGLKDLKNILKSMGVEYED